MMSSSKVRESARGKLNATTPRVESLPAKGTCLRRADSPYLQTHPSAKGQGAREQLVG